MIFLNHPFSCGLNTRLDDCEILYQKKFGVGPATPVFDGKSQISNFRSQTQKSSLSNLLIAPSFPCRQGH